MNLLPQTNNRKPALTEKQESFLEVLFENGGNVNAAAESAGYSKTSVSWLRERLADEIVDRTRTMLAGQSLKAANKLVNLIDTPAIERGDDLRMKVQRR